MSFDLTLDSYLEGIAEALQLTPAQHETAEARYRTVGDWLAAEGSRVAQFRPRIYAQGSLALGTTVKPLMGEEFDLDLVCELQVNWQQLSDPRMLLDFVEARLRENARYATMIERRERCIRLGYANEFHLDVVPACPNPYSGINCIVVPGRAARDWRCANPKGYVRWFDSAAASLLEARKAAEPIPAREDLAEKSPLKIAVQLFKRWRDVAFERTPDLAPASCVLTTFAALHYRSDSSLSRAFAVMLNAIRETLPVDVPIEVRNPAYPQEDFAEKWKAQPQAYFAFREQLEQLGGKWDALLHSSGIGQIKRVLSELFGEEPTQRVLKEHATAISNARSTDRLGVRRHSGVLGAATSAATVPVRKNTFYGD